MRTLIHNLVYLPLIIGLVACSTKSVKQSDETNSKNLEEQVSVTNSENKSEKIDYKACFQKAGLVNVQTVIPHVVVELKYATTDNFMGKVLYPSLKEAYLLPHMVERLKRVQSRLEELKPGYKLVIYDAARPLSIQREMFDRVKGTPQEQYVANPYIEGSEGGFHNYGMAVDLSILDADNKPLDMGSTFDFFGEEAHTTKDKQLLEAGRISEEAYRNRQFLYTIMREQELYPLPNEWWHYQHFMEESDKNKFEILDF